MSNEQDSQATPSLVMSRSKKILLGLTAIALVYGLSLFGEIHGKDIPESYFSSGYPSILGLLNSEIFMGLIFLVTIAVFVYVAYLLWELHEVAVHRAEETSNPHLQLIFALSLCGLFIDKTWWVLAVILSFTSWEIIGTSLSNIIQRGVKGDQP
ncbi:magnesium transporter [Oceanicoccus sagamiensis]|uniref:Magnesium transporter n=1 Tax=Oceanicoccus sagamiensis TaxID=716816 RepID=A0A1X9NGP7_9GAMM|nr:magnesium transporter [Oceanicoccus sagamiensis]ARN73183.1 magnesium transporter [Oceanicoccus sagamiensis]